MISEDDFESVEAEIAPKNQLQVIIKESNIEESLAQEFVINFEEHFRMAAEWAKKAKKIIVTSENQVAEMEQARTARLFLRKKRIEIENFRKEKKDFYLKTGQVIDKVANFLKDTIIPTEEHLERQEKFIELKKKAEDERILAEARAKEEDDRIKREEEDRKEKERLRVENERLRKEAEERERINQEELKRVYQKNEEILQEERKRSVEAEQELQKKRQADLIVEANKAREEERLLKAGDSEKLICFKLAVMAIKIPEVKSAENKRILEDAKSHLYLAISKIKMEEEI